MSEVTDQMVLLVVGINLILAGIIAFSWLVFSMVKKKSSLSSKIMSLLLGIALISFGWYLVADFFNKDKPTTFEASLIKQAEERNKDLPIMLDENTRFDDVTVYGTEIYYRHTVVTRSAEELDREIFHNIMIKKLAEFQCPKPEIVALLKKGVKYRYNYFGNKGVLVTSVVLSKETCGIR